VNVLVIAMLLSAGISGMVASHKDRRPGFWLGLGLVAGPIAVAFLLCLPSRSARAASAPNLQPRSIVDEINGLEEMRQRGIINDDEFRQGKLQVLAWPISSPIPPALSAQQVWADGRRTWASYQPATRSALTDLAGRHGLALKWRDDVPLELAATYPVQPGLALEFSLGLEKGSVHCWGDGWALDAVDLHRPETGLPSDLADALDSLIVGSGRIVTYTAFSASTAFWVSVQVLTNGRWRTVRRRCRLPAIPIWRRCVLSNHDNDPHR
jgi:hypothetical protein